MAAVFRVMKGRNYAKDIPFEATCNAVIEMLTVVSDKPPNF